MNATPTSRSVSDDTERRPTATVGADRSTTVVLDTNALMMPVECDLRLFDGLERVLGRPVEPLDLVVPAAAAAELDELADGSGDAAVAARVGRDLLDRCRVVETDASYADDAVVELATPDSIVVTNDRPLRDRLRDRGVPVVSRRGESDLTVIR